MDDTSKGGVIQSVPSWTWMLLVATCLLIFIIGWVSSCNKIPSATENVEGNNYSSNFPTSGEGYATLDKPIKAYLIPLRTHIKVLGAGHTKFVFASDPNTFFICACKKYEGESGNIEDWYHMPAGNYFIYPYQRDEVAVSWR